jgi:predicted CXXCH cytochrome family protein
MKAMKLSLVIMAAALLTIGLGGVAYAFHAGGVADCGGCHSMHSPMSAAHLLVGSDASSTCLTCHENATLGSYHISTPDANLTVGTAPIQRSPGGDFAWLKKNYAWTAHGTAGSEDGSVHGHSIIAKDQNYNAVDPAHPQSPGGSFMSSNLGCDSCHDPHGKGRILSDGSFATTGAPIIASGSTASANPAAGTAVGIYRILAHPGYTGAPGATFTTWPIAVSPSTYNQTESATMVRIAYGGGSSPNGWGKWCGTCHAAIANMTGLKGHPSHPVDQPLTATFATNYNNYVMTGNVSGTFPAAAPGPYSSLVPYQEANSALATLASHARSNNTVLGGPSATDEVTCFSCHRAHASGWAHALRWNNDTTFIVSNGAYPIEMGRTTTVEVAGAYYDRAPTAFATYQRSLCNKCHVQD